MPGGTLEPRGQRTSTISSAILSRRTERALSAVELQTLLRMAHVQAEGLVQAQKLHEIDHLGRMAMSGHALLVKWGDTLAAGDPLLRDELKFFSDMARMGKGEVLADTIDSFCRESRR